MFGTFTFPLKVLLAAFLVSIAMGVFSMTSAQEADTASCNTAMQGELQARGGEVFAQMSEEVQQAIANFVCTANLDIRTVDDEQLQAILLEASVFVPNLPVFEAVTGHEGSATLASCFDYYSFGSVIPQLTVELEEVVSGTTLPVRGTIENANPYPIVEGTLYVKVFKQRGDVTVKDINGPDVVDQFVAVDGITIDANSTVPVSFEWNVPAFAQSGDYEIATFFTTAKRYNLLGLAFTDDVVGTTVRFRVAGETDTGVAFRKDSVTLNDRDYFFAAYPPRFSSDEPVEVRAVLENTAGRDVVVPVTLELYRWDQQRREHLIETQQQQVSLTEGGTRTVTYTVADTDHPVYLLVMTAQHGDTRSILNVRFVRDGIPGARINFPGITHFPLQKGQEAGLFSCMHSMSDRVTENSELVVTLNDREGNEIHRTNYVGRITGAMMGMVSTFVPRGDYDYAELTAQLFTDGVLVEDVRLTYDCEEINPNSCNMEGEGDMLAGTNPQLLIGIGVALLVILGLGYVFMRPRREEV